MARQDHVESGQTIEAPRPRRRRSPWWLAHIRVAILASHESTDDAQVDVHLYPVSARVREKQRWQQ